MRKGQATRALVLDRAFVLASKVGFEGLTIGTLAERVGIYFHPVLTEHISVLNHAGAAHGR